MATTEILLLKPVDGLGAEGDQVKVRAGYARNFLLPQNWALPVNRANRKQVDALRIARQKREANELIRAQDIAKRLNNTHIAIAVKTGEGGKMFGAVTAQNLIDRLKAEDIELDRKHVHFHAPLKVLGKQTTQIKLHPDVVVDFSFEIVSENPIEQAE